MKLSIINPATEEIIKTLESDSRESVEQKFKQLQDFQLHWRKVSLNERISILRKFNDILEKESDALATDLSLETGKPLWQAKNEINGARNRVTFFTENAEQYLTDEWVTHTGNTREKISYEPLGVVGNISAWNYPYLVGVNVFVPALIAGNTVLYKPSEYATLTGLNIERLLKQAGLPIHALHVAIGGGNIGEVLLQLPLDAYFFTGSYRTGKYIYEKVAPKMVPCQLELGGKDPLYVADDIADLNTVAEAVLEGVIYNAGQSCCAVERVYVHENVYEDFLSRIKELAATLKIGNPLAPEKVDLGPLTRKEQVDFIETQVIEAVNAGANLICGGKRPSGKGYFYPITLLSNVNHSMSLMMDESFGPVVGIQKVKDDAEAIHLMQDTPYGLTAAVYTANEQRALGIMEAMNTGTVYWNCCDRVSAPLPWSGRKHSGIGVTLSHLGIRAFARPKAYHLRG